MKPTRRWFQYSLRSFLVVLTALAVWLGIVVNSAREQREAVKAIEALGGQVLYGPFAMLRLRRTGNDYFQSVEVVSCPVGYNSEPDVRDARYSTASAVDGIEERILGAVTQSAIGTS